MRINGSLASSFYANSSARGEPLKAGLLGRGHVTWEQEVSSTCSDQRAGTRTEDKSAAGRRRNPPAAPGDALISHKFATCALARRPRHG